MPCDSITTQSINLSNALPDILRQALESLGHISGINTETEIMARIDGNAVKWQKGKGLRIQGYSTADNERIATKITQAYSAKAVSWAAQRAGWKVTTTSPNTLKVERR